MGSPDWSVFSQEEEEPSVALSIPLSGETGMVGAKEGGSAGVLGVRKVSWASIPPPSVPGEESRSWEEIHISLNGPENKVNREKGPRDFFTHNTYFNWTNHVHCQSIRVIPKPL